MFMPRPELIFRMLRAVEACGPDGCRARDFAKRYFDGPITPGQVGAGGRSLAFLRKQGYLTRIGLSGDAALHQLTESGRAFLKGFWDRARQPKPSFERPAPTVTGSFASEPRSSPAAPESGYGRWEL